MNDSRFIHYTLITDADIDRCIPGACHTVVRDDILDEGGAGMVDGDYFLYWVKNYLCPVLGNYGLGKAKLSM